MLSGLFDYDEVRSNPESRSALRLLNLLQLMIRLIVAENRVFAANHQTLPPVDVNILGRRVSRVPVLKQHVPARPAATVDVRSVNREVVKEQNVSRFRFAWRPECKPSCNTQEENESAERPISFRSPTNPLKK
jgi:hypothetical protein